VSCIWFLAHMDSGSACSSFTVYGQWFISIYHIMEHFLGIYKLFTWYISSTLWTIILMEMKQYIYFKLIWYYWTILQHCWYQPLELFFSSTCYIQAKSTRQCLRQMSPSSVCIYSGKRLLQSTYLILRVQLVTLFSSYDTHVSCHVMFYIVTCFYCTVCYCMLRVTCVSNSYSVLLQTPLTLYINCSKNLYNCIYFDRRSCFIKVHSLGVHISCLLFIVY